MKQKNAVMKQNTVVMEQKNAAVTQNNAALERNKAAWRQKRKKNTIFLKIFFWGYKPAGSNRLARALLGHARSKVDS